MSDLDYNVAFPRGRQQRLDHRIIGVAFVSLVVEHALAFEARRFFREEAVFIDRVGDFRFDAARREIARIRERVPDYKVDHFLRSFRFDADAEKLFRYAARRIGFE